MSKCELLIGYWYALWCLGRILIDKSFLNIYSRTLKLPHTLDFFAKISFFHLTDFWTLLETIWWFIFWRFYRIVGDIFQILIDLLKRLPLNNWKVWRWKICNFWPYHPIGYQRSLNYVFYSSLRFQAWLFRVNHF